MEGEARPEFADVIAANYQRVYNVILRLIDDREEAADLTQDTFVNACRAYDNFRHESQVYTWLYRIAVNLTKNRLERGIVPPDRGLSRRARPFGAK